MPSNDNDSNHRSSTSDKMILAITTVDCIKVFVYENQYLHLVKKTEQYISRVWMQRGRTRSVKVL